MARMTHSRFGPFPELSNWSNWSTPPVSPEVSQNDHDSFQDGCRAAPGRGRLLDRPADVDVDQESGTARAGGGGRILARVSSQSLSRVLRRVHRVPPILARRRSALSRLAAV